DGDRADVVDPAAIAEGRVVAKDSAGDRCRPAVGEAATERSRVALKGAVGDGPCRFADLDGTRDEDRCVVAERASFEQSGPREADKAAEGVDGATEGVG